MNSDGMKSGNQPVRRRGTPIPVAPPRIPTPMPSNNNNTRSNSKEQDKHHPSSVGADVSKLITKPSYKVLDNDVKTAWINPRLISKIDMEIIKKTDYVLPPLERNMNSPYRPHHHQQYHQKQQNCGRNHDNKEWENPVNGRAKQRHIAAPVPALTSTSVEGRRKTIKPAATTTAGKTKIPMDMNGGSRSHHAQKNNRTKIGPSSGTHQRSVAQRSSNAQERVRGVLGYQQSGGACFVDAGGLLRGSGGGVYGVYAETKYVYAVNGLPENHAQASAAAAFFAR